MSIAAGDVGALLDPSAMLLAMGALLLGFPADERGIGEVVLAMSERVPAGSAVVLD